MSNHPAEVADSLAFDHLEPLDRPLARKCVIEMLAMRLQVGDVIAAPGFVSIIVTGIQAAICGFISIGYDCAAGSGTRVYPAEQLLQVRRIVSEVQR